MANTNIIGDILRAFWDFIDDIKSVYADSKERNIQTIEILDANTFKISKSKVYVDVAGAWSEDKEGRGIHYNNGLVRNLKDGRPWALKCAAWPATLNFKELLNGIEKKDQPETLARVTYAINKKALFKPSVDNHANIGLLAGVIIAFLLGFILKGFMK
jgi:hypothetical protein